MVVVETTLQHIRGDDLLGRIHVAGQHHCRRPVEDDGRRKSPSEWVDDAWPSYQPILVPTKAI